MEKLNGYIPSEEERTSVLLSMKSVLATDSEIGHVFPQQYDLMVNLTHKRPEDTDWESMTPRGALRSFRT